MEPVVKSNQPSNPVEFLAGCLKDDKGNKSSMRLMSLIALITAIAFGGYTLVKPEVKDAGINLTFSFLAAAFAPKAVQKFAEVGGSKGE